MTEIIVNIHSRNLVMFKRRMLSRLFHNDHNVCWYFTVIDLIAASERDFSFDFNAKVSNVSFDPLNTLKCCCLVYTSYFCDYSPWGANSLYSRIFYKCYSPYGADSDILLYELQLMTVIFDFLYTNKTINELHL